MLWQNVLSRVFATSIVIAIGAVAWQAPPSGERRLLSQNAAQAQKRPEIFFQSRQSMIRFVAFSPDGKTLLSADGASVILWNARTGDQLWTLPGRHKEVAAFSPDAKYLVTANEENALRIWNVGSGSI